MEVEAENEPRASPVEEENDHERSRTASPQTNEEAMEVEEENGNHNNPYQENEPMLLRVESPNPRASLEGNGGERRDFEANSFHASASIILTYVVFLPFLLMISRALTPFFFLYMCFNRQDREVRPEVTRPANQCQMDSDDHSVDSGSE